MLKSASGEENTMVITELKYYLFPALIHPLIFFNITLFLMSAFLFHLLTIVVRSV